MVRVHRGPPTLQGALGPSPGPQRPLLGPSSRSDRSVREAQQRCRL